jgi:uncharacterized membrane protein
MSHAQGKGFKFKRLNPPGAAYSFAFGLNNKGTVIVGSFTDASGVYRGFSFSGAKYGNIVFPGAKTFTQANGVNDSNTVVGDFIGKDHLTHGFLLTNNKKFIRFGVKKDVSTYLYGINNTGNLVGYAGNQGNNRGFVSVGGKVTFFTVSGNTTDAFGINASNDVVGFFIPPPYRAAHGFYRAANGKITQLDPPGSVSTACLGINDSGEITGLYVDAHNVSHGFTYKNGRFRTSSYPDIAGMNDKGMYVGSYIGHDGKNYGYVVKP